MKENGEHLISISCVLRVICISQSNGKSNQMQFAHNCRKFWVCVSVLVCVCVCMYATIYDNWIWLKSHLTATTTEKLIKRRRNTSQLIAL